jgi:integrase
MLYDACAMPDRKTLPMPKPALTPTFLRHVKLPDSGQLEIADGGCPGLRLRLSTSTATWVLGCRDSLGRARRFPLGTFPAMGLKDAREAARMLRAKVRSGHDPIAERRAQRVMAASAAGQTTLSEVLDAYGDLVGHRQRSWHRCRRMIAHVFAAKLKRRASELTAPELQLVVDRHAARVSAGAAVRYLKPVAKWAAKRGLMEVGLAAALEQPADANRRRDRVLARDEIRAILGALDAVPQHGACLRWLFWTACRLDEACSMHWGDVVDGIWTIPVTKTDRPHVVPLPTQAVGYLRNKARGGDGDLVFTNGAGHKLAHWDVASKKLQALTGTAAWHRHDVRRTCATLMGELGIAPHVIEVCLGHALRTSSDGSTVGRIAQVYNRSRYRAEHAEALQKLADELDRIASGAADNVVRLRA